jgi:hypothetical protein
MLLVMNSSTLIVLLRKSPDRTAFSNRRIISSSFTAIVGQIQHFCTSQLWHQNYPNTTTPLVSQRMMMQLEHTAYCLHKLRTLFMHVFCSAPCPCSNSKISVDNLPSTFSLLRTFTISSSLIAFASSPGVRLHLQNNSFLKRRSNKHFHHPLLTFDTLVNENRRAYTLRSEHNKILLGRFLSVDNEGDRGFRGRARNMQLIVPYKVVHFELNIYYLRIRH